MPDFEVGNQENTQQNRVREYAYKRFKGLDRQAERLSTPALASCALSLPPMLLVVAVADDRRLFVSENNEPKRHGLVWIPVHMNDRYVLK